ncbi:MAG: hypothetical protein KIT79_08345 [Deltaproteobacteria bacterium]|nr:hypothetical protein [Deltaproteobacteria bacterium]
MAIRRNIGSNYGRKEMRATRKAWGQRLRAEREARRDVLLAGSSATTEAVPEAGFEIRQARQRVREKAHQWVQDLAQETDAARLSDEWLIWLETCAAFNRYSFSNILWIYEQFPEATRVASERVWKSYRRRVKPGEFPIRVVCAVSFRLGRVYDISQTEGEPLPTISWSVEGETPWWDRLLNGAAHLGIAVEPKKEPGGNYSGRSWGGRVEVDLTLSSLRRSLVLIHELAHEILHAPQNEELLKKCGGDTSDVAYQVIRILLKARYEMEAESVAYIVARALGLPTRAPTYIAYWEDRNWLQGGVEDLEQSMNRIQRAAQKILRAAERKRPPKPKPLVTGHITENPKPEEYTWCA